MSEKLILEFYGSDISQQPVACILARWGGDNPSSAATTLADFFSAIRNLSNPRFEDAGLLAARFVSWQGQKDSGEQSYDFIDVCLIRTQEAYDYQVVRIYTDGEFCPRVEFVQDQYTIKEELEQAAIIMGECRRVINGQPTCFRLP
ncbi:MAG TPA: hypothetical protein VGB94_14690 [Acidobacteriaceae bacterium]